MSALRGTAPSTGRRPPSETPPQPTSAGRERISATPGQHPLWLSALLHLLPGAALSAFVVALHSGGVDPLFALLFGIGVVITPFELGYLAVYAKRTLAGAVREFREEVGADIAEFEGAIITDVIECGTERVSCTLFVVDVATWFDDARLSWENVALCWWPEAEVGPLPLHAGFACAWGILNSC